MGAAGAHARETDGEVVTKYVRTWGFRVQTDAVRLDILLTRPSSPSIVNGRGSFFSGATPFDDGDMGCEEERSDRAASRRSIQ